MKNKNKMYCIIYRLRKLGGVKIDTRRKTIFYMWNDEDQQTMMKHRTIERLCIEYGFARQAVF